MLYCAYMLYAPPQKFFNFLLNGAFCTHSEAFIRQLTRRVTTMLKPAKTSDIIAKSYIAILCV